MWEEPIVFSASIGQGHNQAARALKDELIAQGFPRVSMIDTFHFIHPLLHHSIALTYQFILRYQPCLWAAVFEKSEVSSTLFQSYEKLLRFFSKYIEKIIEEKKPPFIISTHPCATSLIAYAKEKNNWQIPLHSVITDFQLHPTYVHKDVTSYFTIDEAAELIAVPGIDLPNIYETGIPFPTKVPSRVEAAQFRLKLGVKQGRAIIVLAGGGLGLSSYHVILNELERVDIPLTIFCMTGHNGSAQRKLMQYKSKHDLRIVSYTEQFVFYLAISDVAITKAGGLTLSEALACEIPVILYEPLPGHEEQNAALAVKWGVALHAYELQQITTYVERILTDDALRKKMILSARRHKKDNAAQNIIKEITFHSSYFSAADVPFVEATKK